MSEKIKLLDCTLRDGGYYNNWNFHFPSVRKYLHQIYSSKIDIVEIGSIFSTKILITDILLTLIINF